MVVFGNRELIDDHPVIFIGIVEVNDSHVVVDNPPFRPKLDRDTFHQESLELPIACDQGRGVHASKLPKGVLESFWGKGGIQARKGTFKAFREERV